MATMHIVMQWASFLSAESQPPKSSSRPITVMLSFEGSKASRIGKARTADSMARVGEFKTKLLEVQRIGFFH